MELRPSRDLAVLDGTMAYWLFMTIVEFPAMGAGDLRRMVGGRSGKAGRMLVDFVAKGLGTKLTVATTRTGAAVELTCQRRGR